MVILHTDLPGRTKLRSPTTLKLSPFLSLPLVPTSTCWHSLLAITSCGPTVAAHIITLPLPSLNLRWSHSQPAAAVWLCLAIPHGDVWGPRFLDRIGIPGFLQ